MVAPDTRWTSRTKLEFYYVDSKGMPHLRIPKDVRKLRAIERATGKYVDFDVTDFEDHIKNGLCAMGIKRFIDSFCRRQTKNILKEAKNRYKSFKEGEMYIENKRGRE